MITWYTRYMDQAGDGDGGSGDSGAGSGEGTGDGADGGDSGDAGAGGDSGEDWRAVLPEDLRGSPAIKDIGDIASLTRTFIDTQAMVGRSVRIPSEDAGPEDRQKFLNDLQERVPGLMPTPNLDDNEVMAAVYRQLGQPEKAGDYEVPEIEGYQLPDDRQQFLRETAHEAGISQRQFKHVMGKILAADAAVELSAKKAHAESIERLKGETGWGNAYDTTLAQVKNWVGNSDAPSALKSAVAEGRAGAETLTWLRGLMTSAGEGSHVGNQDNSGASLVMTPQEAQARIDEIMNNKQHPYWVAGDPGHQAAMDRMVELQQARNPGSVASLDPLRASGSATGG